MADADVLRRRMVEGLAQRGELDERWRAAFTELAGGLVSDRGGVPTRH